MPKHGYWLSNQIFMQFPCGLERVNREIKRRTRVAVLFPNAESALRLVTGVLIEIHEEWIAGNLWLDMSITEQRTCSITLKEEQAV